VSTRAEAATGARITARAVVLAAIVLVLAVAAAGPIRNFLAQRSEIDRLESRITELETERSQLSRELERIRDPEHVERLARCMGMVRPGEIAFVNPDAPRPRGC
jgi:cell division protein FtsB